MLLRTALAAALALACAAPAFAQSAGQTPGGATVPGHAQYCPNGVTNADGTIQVVPCGSNAAPMSVVIVNPASQAPPTVTVNPALGMGSCKPNPITGNAKPYPFCF